MRLGQQPFGGGVEAVEKPGDQAEEWIPRESIIWGAL